MEISREGFRDKYVTLMNDKFGSLTAIDVDAEANAVTVPWFNQTLTTVNDTLVRMGVFHGEYHWHKHEDQDESSSCSTVNYTLTSRDTTTSFCSGIRATPSQKA